MRYYSEKEVARILYDIDKDIKTLPQEVWDYEHIDLPDKYGRLIDADERGKVLLDKYTEGPGKWDEFYSAGYRYALKFFSQAPTVLEASK